VALACWESGRRARLQESFAIAVIRGMSDNDDTRTPRDDPNPAPTEKVRIEDTTWLILLFMQDGHLMAAILTRPPGGGASITALGA
jgi:hypothetical protein